jgi:hypothetical protein
MFKLIFHLKALIMSNLALLQYLSVGKAAIDFIMAKRYLA